MPREKLRRLLNQLHDELSESPPMDDTEKTLLRNIADEIESALGTEKDLSVTDSEADLSNSLKEATAQFEASHPHLVGTLTQISDLLRTIGIR